MAFFNLTLIVLFYLNLDASTSEEIGARSFFQRTASLLLQTNLSISRVVNGFLPTKLLLDCLLSILRTKLKLQIS